MFTDDDEPRSIIGFVAGLFTFLGTFPLVAGLWAFLVLPVAESDPAYVRSRSELVLIIEGIAGFFLLITLVLDLWRNRSKEMVRQPNRVMSNLPFLSLYPHPLLWILGFELSLWILLVGLNGIALLRSFLR